MRWMEFIDYGPMPDRKVKKIPVKELGIPKFVYVKTRKNGGVSV